MLAVASKGASKCPTVRNVTYKSTFPLAAGSICKRVRKRVFVNVFNVSAGKYKYDMFLMANHAQKSSFKSIWRPGRDIDSDAFFRHSKLASCTKRPNDCRIFGKYTESESAEAGRIYEASLAHEI